MRGTAIMKNLAVAVKNEVHDSITSWDTLRGVAASLLLMGTIMTMVQPAAAVEFCNTALGGLMGNARQGSVDAAGTLIVVSLVLTIILKVLPSKTTDRLGNVAFGGFVLGLIMLVAGFSGISMVNDAVPVDISSTCGGGSSTSSEGGPGMAAVALMILTAKIGR